MPKLLIQPLEPVTWQNMRAHTFELDSAIDIWRINISSAPPRLLEILAQDELEKMNKYYSHDSRNQFVAGRGGLRYLSGRYIRQSPDTLILDRDTNKKPYWKYPEGARLQFSIAHSGGYVLIAFAREAIGVDIEKTNGPFEYKEIPGRYFHPDEIDEIQKSATPAELFYLLWTRKEALLKASAKGIHEGMRLVSCIDGLQEVNSEAIGSGNDWVVRSFEPAAAYIASIAYHPAVTAIRFWDMENF